MTRPCLVCLVRGPWPAGLFPLCLSRVNTREGACRRHCCVVFESVVSDLSDLRRDALPGPGSQASVQGAEGSTVLDPWFVHGADSRLSLPPGRVLLLCIHYESLQLTVIFFLKKNRGEAQTGMRAAAARGRARATTSRDASRTMHCLRCSTSAHSMGRNQKTLSLAICTGQPKWRADSVDWLGCCAKHFRPIRLSRARGRANS